MLQIRALLLLAFLAAAPAFAIEPVTLQLKWRNAFQFAGYYTALWKGYYRDAGFDVTIREAEPGQSVVDEVVAGRAQFGVGTSSLLLAWHGGKPVVVLGVVFQHSPYVIVARQDAGIGSIHDIVDKRLMMEPMSDEILAYLQREGIPMDRVTRLEHTFKIEDLVEGRTDAIVAYVTNQPFHLRRAGVPYLAFSPRSAGVDCYGDNLFTSKQLLERQPERAQAFRDASMRGWEYAMAHPDEIVAMILPSASSGRCRRQGRRSMAAQVRCQNSQGRGQRGQDGTIGRRVESVGVAEDQIDRPLGIAEIENGHLARAPPVGDGHVQAAGRGEPGSIHDRKLGARGPPRQRRMRPRP